MQHLTIQGGIMQYDQSVLTGTERRIFALRTLYSRYGYSPYRMRKFEEYDLYSRNKDFLLSDRIITFTDTNGRLMALKPDVTLSIVRNIEDRPYELQRLYYDENVYRVSGRTNAFKEIMQMGLECIGAANNPSVTEIMDLAEQSLSIIAEGHDYVLKVSDLDIITLMIDEITGDISDGRYIRSELMRLAGEKNLHEITQLCIENEIDAGKVRPFIGLLELYGEPEEVFPQLEKICEGTAAYDEAFELISVVRDLYNGDRAALAADPCGTDGAQANERQSRRNIVIDFSLTSNTRYYNGIAFEGYIDGVPECVLVGGRYDMLMQRMKKKSRAIGFAVYLDTLARLKVKVGDEAIDRFYRNISATTADGRVIPAGGEDADDKGEPVVTAEAGAGKAGREEV